MILDTRISQVVDEERIISNARVVSKLERKFPAIEVPGYRALVRPSDSNEPIQRWFHYREGYTVDLVRRLLLPSDQFVIDPFCGFGSTLLAAKHMGIQTAGFDVNPLAVFVSRVKTASYSENDVRELRALRKKIAGAKREGKSSSPPKLRILDKLFDPEILHALLVLKAIIKNEMPSPAASLASLCWLKILEQVSNVFREGNGIKYRNRLRKGNTYRTVPIEEWARNAFPLDKFTFVKSEIIQAIDQVLEDVGINRKGLAGAEVHELDSAQMSSVIGSEAADAAIFSPPYCNCFNYIKAYKVELWMGDFIESYGNIATLTERGVRSRVESLRADDIQSPSKNVERIAQLVSEGELWSELLPNVVRGYFADMSALLSQVYSCLRVGGRSHIVVGNSALAGVLIPTDLLLCELAEQSGFTVSSVQVARHLTTSSQQRLRLRDFKSVMRESVIELRK